jgi:hypothetical protein
MVSEDKGSKKQANRREHHLAVRLFDKYGSL